MRLRKHIKCYQGVKPITSGEQYPKIARQRCRITGDVCDLRRTKLKYFSQRSTFDSCSRRIKQQKINCAIDRLVVLHPVIHATADDFCVRQLRFLEIAARKARGKRTSFYTDNGRKPSRQRDCEQTNATIQIDSQCALTIVDRR